MTFRSSLSLIGVENSIQRLDFPAFHPRSFPINERRIQYKLIVRSIDDLYDYSIIDEFMRDQLSDRALDAYVHGGL